MSQAIRRFDAEINARCAELPDFKIFSSFSGAGAVLSDLLSDETYLSMRVKAASIILRSMGALGAALAPGATNPEDIRADWSGARYQRELRSLGGL